MWGEWVGQPMALLLRQRCIRCSLCTSDEKWVHPIRLQMWPYNFIYTVTAAAANSPATATTTTTTMTTDTTPISTTHVFVINSDNTSQILGYSWMLDLLNPFTAPACKMFGLNDARTRLQTYFFRSYNTSTFSAMRFDKNPFTCQSETEDKKA